MLKIRLQRIGRRNDPSYRVVVVDSTAAARKGNPVELLGTHDAIRKKTALNNERVLYWMSQGAQVSGTMHNILIKNGVIEGVKVNVLPKKRPVKKEEGSEGADQGSVEAESEKEKDVSAAANTDEASPTHEKNAEETNEGQEPSTQEKPSDTPSAEG